MENKKPKIFLICKILSIIFLSITIVGIVLSVKGFDDFESNFFMIGAFLSSFGIFFTIITAVIGFKPEMHKTMVKSVKYIQSENKSDLQDIAGTNAEIGKEAVKISAKAVKEGLTEKEYCKYCGQEIDVDSIYCNKCGKKLK